MYNKDNAENIEKMNAGMGSQHRSAPYDLTNPVDLAHAFLLTVAACMDYRWYWRQLERISEEFDESVEHYDIASWINMGFAPENADELAMESAGAVALAADSFYALVERSDRNCTIILKAILTAPKEIQIAAWGRAYAIPVKELDEQIKELFEALDETDVHYQIEKNRDEFLQLMDEKWGNLK